MFTENSMAFRCQLWGWHLWNLIVRNLCIIPPSPSWWEAFWRGRSSLRGPHSINNADFSVLNKWKWVFEDGQTGWLCQSCILKLDFAFLSCAHSLPRLLPEKIWSGKNKQQSPSLRCSRPVKTLASWMAAELAARKEGFRLTDQKVIWMFKL